MYSGLGYNYEDLELSRNLARRKDAGVRMLRLPEGVCSTRGNYLLRQPREESRLSKGLKWYPWLPAGAPIRLIGFPPPEMKQ